MFEEDLEKATALEDSIYKLSHKEHHADLHSRLDDLEKRLVVLENQ
jgi:chaperonin cofactor prefoldin